MSGNLLQCDFQCRRNKRTGKGELGLLFSVYDNDYNCVDKVVINGKEYNTLYVAWRRPRGTFGHFVVFEYCGEMHVPDLSLPIQVQTLPKDAKRLSDSEIEKYWTN